MKLDILCIAAHPDDIELACSGTVAKEVANGKKVGVLDLTRGELGTRGSAEIRHKEATEASKILGLAQRENMGFADGFFLNDKTHQLEVIKKIRQYQPEIILCNAIDDRHIDHPKGSKLASDACFLSGLIKIKTELNGINQNPWRPKQVYHYIQWKDITPDFVVDITGFIDKKIASVEAYKTQFFNPKYKGEPDTPISSKNFIDSVVYRAKDLGRLVGVEYAEGFTVERYAAVNSLFDLK